nr:hypothetical protein [Microbispora cellulosiformans]
MLMLYSRSRSRSSMRCRVEHVPLGGGPGLLAVAAPDGLGDGAMLCRRLVVPAQGLMGKPEQRSDVGL